MLHENRSCPLVKHRDGFAIVPLHIESVDSKLGAWYRARRRTLWALPKSQAFVSDFARIYVLRHKGGGTYMDLDCHITNTSAFWSLPESVIAEASADTQHGLAEWLGPTRFNGAFLRMRPDSPSLLAMERDWIEHAEHIRGADGTVMWGMLGPVAVTRVIAQQRLWGDGWLSMWQLWKPAVQRQQECMTPHGVALLSQAVFPRTLQFFRYPQYTATAQRYSIERQLGRRPYSPRVLSRSSRPKT